MSPEQISAIAAFGQIAQALISCLTFLVALGATLFALRQLGEMSKARSMTILLEAYKMFELDENWKLRQFMYEISNAPGKLSRDEQQKFEECIRHVDSASYLVQKGFVSQNEFLELYCTIMLTLWSKLEPFVVHERKKRANPYWASHFEWLATQAKTYRAKYLPDFQVSFFKSDETLP